VEARVQSGWTTSSVLVMRGPWLSADIVGGAFTTAVTVKTSQSSVTLATVSRVVRILCQKIANFAHATCKFCALFPADFSTLKLFVSLLYDRLV